MAYTLAVKRCSNGSRKLISRLMYFALLVQNHQKCVIAADHSKKFEKHFL